MLHTVLELSLLWQQLPERDRLKGLFLRMTTLSECISQPKLLLVASLLFGYDTGKTSSLIPKSVP